MYIIKLKLYEKARGYCRYVFLVEYLNWQYTDNNHRHSLLYTYLGWDNSKE